jgi:hypothetical protein
MQYRKFGRLDWQASALGFGCMRLPTTDGVARFSPNIDEELAVRMLRHAIDHGVNYVDTAYPYHQGRSEVVVGKALQDGYRAKVKLATKLPVWLVDQPADFDRLLAEQLHKLQTPHIDFYLLHALDRERWRGVVCKQDIMARAAAALADGRIGHLGFSFHDDYEAFAEIVEGSDLWTFCQIQYNYMDIETQAGTRGLKLAAAKDLAVVIMEPLLGGRLVEPPPDVCQLMERFSVKRSPVDWALQWLWDQPEISVVLSGMSTMAQVGENLRCAEVSQVQRFTAEEHEVVALARGMYHARGLVPCTKCGYCLPCPNGVNIPGAFEHFNYAHLYGDVADARFKYRNRLTEEERAAACLECGTCEEQCPQKIATSEWMPKVAALLD